MKRLGEWLGVSLLLVLTSCDQPNEEEAAVMQEVGLPPLRAEGTQWVDPSGTPVALQGVNLGNWLIWEAWMFGWFDIRDQHAIRSIIENRFGAEVLAELEDAHRRTWITEADFQRIREWGFNVVRLPFHYSLIEDPANPGHLNPTGLQWLSDAVRMAGENGLYTILDFHGVPGGQSADQCTGRADQNLFWDNEEYQDRFISLWRELAAHFRGNSHIAALDVLNEPFGAGSKQHFEPKLVEVFGRAYDAIRGTGNQSVLLAPGTLRGIYFWPSPAEMGWEQVAFTEHFYPGVFGGEPTLKEHADFFSNKLAGRKKLLEQWQAPFLVGEFNPIFRSAGGTRMLVEHFRRYAEWGWAATMWTYKMITPEGGIPPENWPLWTNANPVAPPDLASASLDELRAFFSGKDVTEWVADSEFLALYRDDHADRMAMKGISPVAFPESGESPPDGWKLAAVGMGTPEPDVMHTADGSWELYAAGWDINHGDDGFGFLFSEVNGDFDLQVSLEEFEASARWAKAGLMARESLQPGSPMFLWNIFQNEKPSMMTRKNTGRDPIEKSFIARVAPVWLRMTRKGETFSIFHSPDGSEWVKADSVTLPDKPTTLQVGLAVCSNDGHLPARLKFSSLSLHSPTSESPQP
jgi:regulation of enolase protein 1 (concanavalin A-like superfamily)